MAAAKTCNACGQYFKISKNENKANALAFSYSDPLDRICNTIEVFNVCPSCLQKVHDMVDNHIDDDDFEEE